MKLAVIDANIFIDLIKLQMLSLLFRTEMEISTTREIIDQLREDQLKELNLFIVGGNLTVYLLSEEELEEVVGLPAPRSLELADKSVTWLALKLRAIVISADGPLRKFCEEKKLDVRGIVWLFEVFLDKKLMDHPLAAEKMNQLLGFNNRLPKETCKDHIRKWLGQ